MSRNKKRKPMPKYPGMTAAEAWEAAWAAIVLIGGGEPDVIPTPHIDGVYTPKVQLATENGRNGEENYYIMQNWDHAEEHVGWFGHHDRNLHPHPLDAARAEVESLAGHLPLLRIWEKNRQGAWGPFVKPQNPYLETDREK